MPVTLIIIIVAAVLVLWVIGVYNSLVSTRTRIGAAIQEIGNQLKRQSDLIPNLEESVKGYLKHETGIIKMISEARKLIASGKDASSKVNDIVSKLQVVVESNPQIKGAEVVTNLMDELRDTSDKVMYARRLLIDLTADFNTKLVTFPSNIIASMFGFKSEKGLQTPEGGDFLTVSETETKTPKVSM